MSTGQGTGRYFLIALTSVGLVSLSRAFISLPFNTTYHFGPDGPWQAVVVRISYPGASLQEINLYPSAQDDYYSAFYVPMRGAGISPPTNFNLTYFTWFSINDLQTNYGFLFNGSNTLSDVEITQNITLKSTAVDFCNVAKYYYPNGATIPAEVGFVALGGKALSRSIQSPAAAHKQNQNQSNTYGLHIGVAKLGYSGSLVFGGYDKGRVIGPVMSFIPNGDVQVIDIMIGVETGASPFDFGTQSGLVSSATPLTVLLQPDVPYIFMPPVTVEAIASNLPVTLDSRSGYYLWNTQDPLYARIVSSPAYLGFVFSSVSASGVTGNTTIKVPFSLLNLTLESSVSGYTSDVPYLPIMKTRNEHFNNGQKFSIMVGRAFLQAAFMGTNWNQNVAWLAQAPGPGSNGSGLGYDPVDLANDATTLEAQTGDDLFNISWQGHWTPLPRTPSHVHSGGNTATPNPGNALTGATIAGIVVGVVVGLILIGVVVFLLVRQKRRRSKTADAGPGLVGDKSGMFSETRSPVRADGKARVPEIPELESETQEYFEAPAHSEPKELAERKDPQELP